MLLLLINTISEKIVVYTFLSQPQSEVKLYSPIIRSVLNYILRQKLQLVGLSSVWTKYGN